jgi:hypothetical protein
MKTEENKEKEIYWKMGKKYIEEEFELAKKSVEFARNMLKWWEKDKKLDIDGESLRAWEGTALISKWFRETNQKGVELK